MLRFLIGIICILLHRPKKLTLTEHGHLSPFQNLISKICKKPIGRGRKEVKRKVLEEENMKLIFDVEI